MILFPETKTRNLLWMKSLQGSCDLHFHRRVYMYVCIISMMDYEFLLYLYNRQFQVYKMLTHQGPGNS